MNDNLNFALKYVFKNEGGYSNDPKDKGGPTMWGVTIHEWERYYNRKLTPNEVKQMKIEDACRIYELKYWNYAGLNKIEDQYKATAIFDQCVNRGVSKGVSMAVEAVNMQQSIPIALTLDEIIAINEFDRKSFIIRYAQIARASYQVLALNPKFWRFRRGWLNRAERLKTLAV